MHSAEFVLCDSKNNNHVFNMDPLLWEISFLKIRTRLASWARWVMLGHCWSVLYHAVLSSLAKAHGLLHYLPGYLSSYVPRLHPGSAFPVTGRLVGRACYGGSLLCGIVLDEP